MVTLTRSAQVKFCSRRCAYDSFIGKPSWNKGLKGYSPSPDTQFKKGHIPWFVKKGVEPPCAGWNTLNDSKERKKLMLLAREAARRAIRDGALQKGDCEVCGSPNVIAHHDEGYEPDKWLIVKWLCRSCHSKHHNQEFKLKLGKA